MFKRIVWLLVLGHVFGVAQGTQPQITYTKLPDKKLDQALSEARADAGVPPDVTVTVSQDIDPDIPGAMATIDCVLPESGSGPCQWVVTIHNPIVRTDVPKSSSNDFAVDTLRFS